ncbi:MAG: spermidine/putrescine ABC transporter substrate-binding protein [Deltaproteobacteria bacterium]|jgi:spermidine/putrescine transport system substrate-binding protein|nr:spermidine/putrescine ABC transporter substrate-binding protein [Deltaproteobacteria bacterium]
MKKNQYYLIAVTFIALVVCAFLAWPRPEAAVEVSKTIEPQAVNKAPPRRLNLFIWSEYIDPDVVAEFEKTHNVKIRIDLYESNEEMISMLKTGASGAYDLIVPSTYYLPSLINLNLIQPLNHSLLVNINNIDIKFRNLKEDPGNKYNIPYQWGISGLVARSKDLQSLNNSWELLFKPSPTKGNFVIFDTARDAIGSALRFLGYSSNTVNLSQIEQAGNLLIETKQNPTFLGFNGGVDGLSKVVGGVANIAQVYNGEAIKATEEDPEIQFVIPKEGCEIWLDVFAIPVGAANADVAHEFLNFILEPKIAARLALWSSYATPNHRALEFIEPQQRDNPAIYPSSDLLSKMEFLEDLGTNGRLYEETWTIVKSR